MNTQKQMIIKLKLWGIDRFNLIVKYRKSALKCSLQTDLGWLLGNLVCEE